MENNGLMTEGCSCNAMGYKDVSVCVPVTVKSFGVTGEVTTECLSEAEILKDYEYPYGENSSECNFYISQKLRITVPVCFGAEAEIGEFSVDCNA